MEGLGGSKASSQWSEEEEALWAALEGRGQRTDDDEAITAASAAASKSVQETKMTDEEALSAALKGRAERTDEECHQGTLSTREQPVEEPASAGDDWVGVWGRRSLPRLEEQLAATIASKEELVPPSCCKESSLLLSVLLREPAAGRGGACMAGPSLLGPRQAERREARQGRVPKPAPSGGGALGDGAA